MVKKTKAKKLNKRKLKKKARKISRIVKAKRIKPKPKKKVRKVFVARKKTEEVSAQILVDDTFHKTRIRIIAIGGGAGSIIAEIAPDVKKVDFYAANTDTKSLDAFGKKVKKFQFGQGVTRGLGTGMNDQLGEMAATNDKEKIKKLFEGQDLCVIVACLGGGTSSGAAPVFAKIAKGMGIMTIGIFTMPFSFEGGRKMEMAQKSLEKIKQCLNVYTVIPNEKIFELIEKNAPLKTALSAINKKLAENLEGLIEMIYLPGLINIDFADLRTVLEGHGRLAYLNNIGIDNIEKEDAIKKLVSSPLYPYTLKGARAILYNITGGAGLQLSQVSAISRIIADSVNVNAKIIFGINQSKKYQNRIRVTLLATGCGQKLILPKAPAHSGIPSQRDNLSTPTIMETVVKKIINRRPAPQLRSGQAKKSLPNKMGKAKKSQSIIKNQGKEAIKAASQEKPQLASVKPPEPKQEIEKIEVKIRRNGLQLKQATEDEEKEFLDQEKEWETPAILRKKDIDSA